MRSEEFSESEEEAFKNYLHKIMAAENSFAKVPKSMQYKIKLQQRAKLEELTRGRRVKYLRKGTIAKFSSI